tara:strand:+ start:1376 stop:2095 length:720 start_codon:yes stop_codon:yes gene_type:complete
MKLFPKHVLNNVNLKPSLKANIVNTAVFGLWGFHESYMMNNYNINTHQIYESAFHLIVLTWQYVGLFIISHDLHHSEKPNLYQQILGRLSLLCYGGFFLEQFSEKHFLHHEYPGVDGKDPDFHDGNPFIWYLKFMTRYINLYQVAVQLIVYNLAKYCNFTDDNLIFFWLLPSVFASIQLFFYGTYLVHEKDGVIKNSNLPDWLVTLTSYNFGHHQNHHKYPKLPWFDLKRDKEDIEDSD